MSLLFCNTNIYKTIFTPQNNTDRTILFIEGNSEEVVQQIQNIILHQNLEKFSSVRIRVKGTLIRNKRYCCQAWTVILGSIILFPIFALCTDCYKQKVWKIQEVKEQVYKNLSRLLKLGNFNELYLSVEDNLLNAEKMAHLREGACGKVHNFFMVNPTRAFNVLGQNYDDANKYFRSLLREIDIVQCRWDREVWTNVRTDKL